MQKGVAAMNKNVLDAIRDGDWFFEPEDVDPSRYRATKLSPARARNFTS